MRLRLLALGAAAALIVAASLSLMGFSDRDVPCGPPLFGADPPENYSITPGTRSDMASDRLLLAAGFLAVGVVLAIAPVINTWKSLLTSAAGQQPPGG